MLTKKLRKVIERAIRLKHVTKDGFVRCDNCGNPADRNLAQSMSWVPCGPCCFGESDALDFGALLRIDELKEPTK